MAIDKCLMFLVLLVFTYYDKIIAEELSDSCKQKVEECVLKGITYEDVMSIETSCCMEGFSDDGTYSYERQEKCTKESHSFNLDKECPDIRASGCYEPLVKYWSKSREDIAKFRKEVRAEVGAPRSKEVCPKYAVECKVGAITKCKNVTEAILTWPCELLERRMEKSALFAEICINHYGQCLADMIPKEKIMEDTAGSCRNNFGSTEFNEKFVSGFIDLNSEACLELPQLLKLCRSIVLNYTQDNSPKWKEFLKTALRETNMPASKDDCEKYEETAEKEVIRACKLNTHEECVWYCDVITSIISRPFQNEVSSVESVTEVNQ